MNVMENETTNEKLIPRELCNRIKNLFEKAENVKVELELSAGDTVLFRRAKGLEDYQKCLMEYYNRYNTDRENLLKSIGKEVLMDFIAEQAVSHPGLYIDLAIKLNISNQWGSFPGRGIRE
jgi:hypothetical protein